MASIQFKPLSALQPIELHYQYSRDEELNHSLVSYADGFNCYELDGLANYQDIAINSGSCLMLTSAVSLSSFFTSQDTHNIGRLPGTITLQKRGDNTNYFYYDTDIDGITLNPISSKIFINPIPNTDEVELLIDGKYLQVDSFYPYKVRASFNPLKGSEEFRQRFTIDTVDTDLAINTVTGNGPRYLAFSSDPNNFNILFAIGCILNNKTLNDYIFNVTGVTSNTIEHGHIPNNAWVTYFMDLESETENKSVSANKIINNNNINYLIDFPYQSAIETGKANINIANLKTDYTPTGSPAPVDNTYLPDIITTN